ncbi:UNKNOWN [Stylonychia lemnae]|uniref:Uncharacterized protein n=1 Tax=Stylonychia lemnae TaxID=5949 RepID=A0A078B7R8_STYLE|nr:UNKNOWN [Stylonychia lemnae]|eukprot:CDW90424.1 UNKNOWN [Stylonychia lemnae]
MRPTDLNFRSPKQRTAEILYPIVKNDGKTIDLAYDQRIRLRSSEEKKRYSSFNQEKRFNYYDAMIISRRRGPGAYETQNENTILQKVQSSKRKSKEPFIGLGKNYNNGLSQFGNTIMFDDTFANKDFKKTINKLQRDTVNYINQDVKFEMTAPLYSTKDISGKEFTNFTCFRIDKIIELSQSILSKKLQGQVSIMSRCQQKFSDQRCLVFWDINNQGFKDKH